MVYYMDLWVGDLVGQNAIFGMNFMVPAGVRIDTADGTACLPDEVRIQMIGRRPLYGSRMRPVTIPSLIRVAAGQTYDVPLRPEKGVPRLWVTRGATWVTSLIKAPVGRRTYLRVTNIGEKSTVLDAHTTIGWWTPIDAVPRAFGFVQPGSRKYDEWQKLVNTESTDAVKTRDALSPKLEHGARLGTEHEHGPRLKMGSTEEPDPSFKEIAEYEYADEGVIFHEGSDLFTEDVEVEMAVLPEVPLTAEIVWKKRKWLIGKGNALPPAAKGVICDIDVGNARPVAQRVRKISSQFREKLADLIRGLLSARMIRASKSPWASPIVVIVKKNGVDIRLCVDYRLVNGLTQLMVYPMPLVTDLLEDLDKYRWYLDMASGFWVVPMTDRARLISAFITPFGLFEWLRMPFGLCNAPQIYQRLIDNALYGFWKLSPTDDTRDVFKDGVPSNPGTRSVLGRRSYIDDILIGGKSWDDLCEKVERLLEVCEEWHLSISVEKSEWGIPRMDYLGHEVSENGLGAKPKNLEALAALDFPRTQKGLQSFLGSLNYYHRFIPDFAIFATALYSLSARDFEERATNPETRDVEKWDHAERAFETLRSKIAAIPMLKHFDVEPVVIVYASDWAVSAVLTQAHDGVYMPVKFTNRTLKPNELNYTITEKEILALLRVLNECHNMLVGKTIRVLTRHTTLGWLFRSKGLQGRLSQWAAILSPWRLEILRSAKGEEEILGALAASITSRTHVDSALVDIAPRKRSSKTATIPVPKIGPTESLHVISFDGSARVKREGGAFSAVVWQLPNWGVVKAASGYAEGLAVNEAEYRERETRGTDDPVAELETRGPDNERRGTGRVCPVTTRSRDASRQITRRQPEDLKELQVQRLRLDRVRTAQDEELWITNLKKFLSGDI
ncbi:reverse transcriptase, partial [Phytophthora megakarya]